MKKTKHYLIENATLMKDWDWDKNNPLELNPNSLSCGSDKKVWWKCSICHHEWTTTVGNRASLGRNCPNCAKLNKKNDIIKAKLKSKGSLEDNAPQLLQEWDYTKNAKNPNEYLTHSAEYVWWKCNKCQHEWKAKISHRVDGVGCPICAKELAIKNRTDSLLKTHSSFAESCPNLMKEWDWIKNKDVDPHRILKMSNLKVWWKCKKGHQWQAVIHTRVNGVGCPICQKELHTSFPEKCLYYYLKKYFDDAVENHKPKYLNKMEFDIFIPSINTGFEYDGQKWHKDLNNDIRKNDICESEKIFLIRLRENSCPIDNRQYNYVKYIQLDDDSRNELSQKIYQILYNLGIKKPIVDIDKDYIKIYELLEMSEKQNSIAEKCPNLIDEWNYEKNGTIKPEFFNYKSNKKVWWKCSICHYEWQANIYTRSSGCGCPVCAGQKILVGYNDLATTNPELCKEWDYVKNETKPEMYSKGTKYKAWWKCKKGHQWQAAIYSRVNGTGCPVCAGQKVLIGYNDLLTVNPNLSKEWNYAKNELRPENFSRGAKEKVWWQCNKGHEWKATIASRHKGNGCPICNGKKILVGYNDLATTNPKLAMEWNYEKNILKPNEVVSGDYKVWWKCNKGHEWEATIAKRKNGGSCPICSNKKVLKGYNDLATTNPELCKEWNYAKNELRPENFTKGSQKKVWWECSICHYEWTTTIHNRSAGTGCPICYKENRKNKTSK